MEYCRVTAVTWFVEHEPRLVDFRDASRLRARFDARHAIPHDRLSQGEHVANARNPPEDAWRFEWLRLAKRDRVRANVSPDAAALVEIWRRGHALVDVVNDAVVLAAAAPKLEAILDVLV
jgi:hypothetical protein